MWRPVEEDLRWRVTVWGEAEWLWVIFWMVKVSVCGSWDGEWLGEGEELGDGDEARRDEGRVKDGLWRLASRERMASRTMVRGCA